jgi:hypothetical protein
METFDLFSFMTPEERGTVRGGMSHFHQAKVDSILNAYEEAIKRARAVYDGTRLEEYPMNLFTEVSPEEFSRMNLAKTGTGLEGRAHLGLTQDGKFIYTLKEVHSQYPRAQSAEWRAPTLPHVGTFDSSRTSYTTANTPRSPRESFGSQSRFPDVQAPGTLSPRGSSYSSNFPTVGGSSPRSNSPPSGFPAVTPSSQYEFTAGSRSPRSPIQSAPRGSYSPSGTGFLPSTREGQLPQSIGLPTVAGSENPRSMSGSQSPRSVGGLPVVSPRSSGNINTQMGGLPQIGVSQSSRSVNPYPSSNFSHMNPAPAGGLPPIGGSSQSQVNMLPTL